MHKGTVQLLAHFDFTRQKTTQNKNIGKRDKKIEQREREKYKTESRLMMALAGNVQHIKYFTLPNRSITVTNIITTFYDFSIFFPTFIPLLHFFHCSKQKKMRFQFRKKMFSNWVFMCTQKEKQNCHFDHHQRYQHNFGHF